MLRSDPFSDVTGSGATGLRTAWLGDHRSLLMARRQVAMMEVTDEGVTLSGPPDDFELSDAVASEGGNSDVLLLEAVQEGEERPCAWIDGDGDGSGDGGGDGTGGGTGGRRSSRRRGKGRSRSSRL